MGCMYCHAAGQGALRGTGNAAGGPGGDGTGAVRERAGCRCQHGRKHGGRSQPQPASLAAPVQPAHLLCALPVCFLLSHGQRSL